MMSIVIIMIINVAPDISDKYAQRYLAVYAYLCTNPSFNNPRITRKGRWTTEGRLVETKYKKGVLSKRNTRCQPIICKPAKYDINPIKAIIFTTT